MSEILKKIKKTGNLPGELVIDAHGHVGRHYWLYIPYSDSKAMVNHIDKFCVSAILVSHYNSVAGDCALGNDHVYKTACQYPGRIIPYAGVNPHQKAACIRAEIERNVKRNFKMLKFHPAWHEVESNHKGYLTAMKVANEHGLIVKNHMWPDAQILEKWIYKYPNVTFIMGHPPLKEYFDLVKNSSNLFICITACLDFGSIEKLTDSIGSDKVLLGSDANFLSAGYGIGLIAYSRLSDQEKRKILGLNIAGILDKHEIYYADIREKII